MARISYLGKISVQNMFKCHMCSKPGRDRYKAVPSIPNLVDWKEIIICKNCSKREVGSKNKEEWNKIHDMGRDV